MGEHCYAWSRTHDSQSCHLCHSYLFGLLLDIAHLLFLCIDKRTITSELFPLVDGPCQEEQNLAPDCSWFLANTSSRHLYGYSSTDCQW